MLAETLMETAGLRAGAFYTTSAESEVERGQVGGGKTSDTQHSSLLSH